MRLHHFRSAAYVVIVAWAASACDDATSPGLLGPRPTQLEALVDSTFDAATNLPGLLLAVRTTRNDFRWAGAAGYADPATQQPLHPDQPFRIASVTKTFVAAALLRLVERGSLNLDAAIDGPLSDPTAALLRAGGYDPGAITLRQLLSHTSGLWDYVEGEGSDYILRVLSDPTHRWTRTEQLEFAMQNGMPLGAPGTVFGYSDTGYLLAGEILENVSGTSLPQALRTLLRFDRLGLRSTYMESLETAPAGSRPRAHQFIADIDVTEWDPSFDLWGGGGLVSTSSDLTRFFGALLRGEVFENRSTLQAMTTPVVTGVALGLFRSTVGNTECWGHVGFWGVVAQACDRGRVAMVFSANQALPEGFDAVAFHQEVLARIIR